MKVTLVIPVFNEESTIASILEELETYMNNYLKEELWEIIVVNDGSGDDTLNVLKEIEKTKKWLVVVDLIYNYGRGKALRTGLEKAQGEIIVSLDADLSYAPYHVERLVNSLQEKNADIVLASAYGVGGSVKNVPSKRLLLSKFGNMVLSYMFGENITVLTCLVRAYKNEFIQSIDLNSDDKEIHLEILYKAKMLGARIEEVPADLCWRENKLTRLTEAPKKRRSTLKVRKTSSSHLFFALLSKPGLIFWVPALLLLLFSLFVSQIIISLILSYMGDGVGLVDAIRLSMLNATPSWFSAIVSFFLGIQFLTLGFLTSQNKRNHEEIYRTLNAIYSRLKKK
ncbi:MAG: glycosyltransferase family 2 protein [Nitrospinae bacterium]|nr:glycosyltransferase family 2 protein [Nitrospinota bacterium]